MSLATNASGGVVRRQEFDPWGSIRSGGISQTALNDTGQRRDGTGLLYYHARYYDPALSRFISADSVVPGAPDGSMDGVALKPLTVDFHETGFVTGLNAENRQGFWFQLTQTQRQEANAPWGPQNPQALNRYAYVQNNPLRYTDPSGHNHEKPVERAIEAYVCAAMGQFRCGIAAAIAHEAGRVAKELFPENDELSILLRDAFRHAYGAALMQKYLGSWARYALYAHEGGPAWMVLTDSLLRDDPKAYWDHKQDFWNNEIGMSIGATMAWKSDKEIANAVMEALIEGRLRVVDWRVNQGFVSSDAAYTEWKRRQAR